MNDKLKSIAHRALSIFLCVLVAVNVISQCVTYSKATPNASSLLGTNKALGSPILNPNFVSDDWNKWEMLCWGVYLSNFCIPLVDDYNSAFNSNSKTGSQGSGYKALQFGSGSDSANSEVIKDLLDQALNYQNNATPSKIYVTFTEFIYTGNGETIKLEANDPNVNTGNGDSSSSEEGESGEEGNEGDGSSTENVTNTTVSIREATFQDFFLQAISVGDIDKSSGKSYICYMNTDLSGITKFQIKNFDDYTDIIMPKAGSIPAFWVLTNEGKYVKLLDYCDPWDVSMASAMFGRVDASELQGEFGVAFESLWDANSVLGLDCFGNIITRFEGSNRMVFPAACNQNITKTPQRNLVNSWIFNGYNSGYTGDSLVLSMKNTGFKPFDLSIFPDDSGTYSGTPAMGNKWTALHDGTCVLYFDSDDVAYGLVASGDNTDPSLWDIWEDTFNQSISSYTYTPKIETANMGNNYSSSSSIQNALFGMYYGANSIHTINSSSGSSTVKTLTQLYTTTGGTISIFDSKPVAIPVGCDTSDNSISDEATTRRLVNFVYQGYSAGSTGIPTLSGTLNSSYISSALSDATTSKFPSIFREKFWEMFKDYNSTYKDESFRWAGALDWTVPIVGDIDISVAKQWQRVVLAYPASDEMRLIGNVLGVRDGSEFATYATYIYATYLEWYGVTSGTSTLGEIDAVSNFDTDIFNETNDILNIDITKVTDTLSEEELDAQIKNYAWLMLNPSEGRDYRSTMIEGAITDFIYNEYQKIVYGGTSDYNNELYTSNSSGFLNIDTYAENWMTSAFIANYVDIVSVLLMVCTMAVIIVGLIRGRKLSWYLLSIVVVVNTLLLIPSSGDIVPYIANNAVQKMFEGKMTYWALSEAVTNASLESQANSSTRTFEGLTTEQSTLVLTVVKQLNSLNLDRSLMLKKDISNKVLQKTSDLYSQIQSYKSARWLLPMIMEQYTADDGSANYIYTSLGNYGDDLSNMYWYYKPADAEYADTLTSTQEGSYITEGERSVITGNGLTYCYPDWIDTSADYSLSDIKYKSVAYDDNELIDTPHRYFFYLLEQAGPISRKTVFNGVYDPETSFSNYIDMSNSSGIKWDSIESTIETYAATYLRDDRTTVNSIYGYLWSTENPYHYFYESVKDSFESDISYANLMNQLMGEYNLNSSGEEVRDNFMYATRIVSGEEYPTGYIRDVLDLEELITNMLPYLYQVQLATGGFDLESGFFVDSTITSKSLTAYIGTNKAWLFRSNWATKVMESSEYNKAAVVYDAAGNKYTVDNPLLAEFYPANRPMIFSEAQMVAEGLTEEALNIVELKCIEVNKQTVKDWTLLLNYANMDGMTKEVVYRQMALIALLNFNNEFSGTGLISSATTLYPTSVDLRSISFDSVMKMLMLNVTKDSSYIYGDTMKTVIEDSHIVQAALILVCAMLCTVIVPFFRNIVLGLIFYLGFISILYSLFASLNTKKNIACGQLLTNLAFLVLTLCYYGILSLLINMTTSDEVLTLSQSGVQVGSPLGVLILILIASIAYFAILLKLVWFCLMSFKDMGYETYKGIANVAVTTVSNKISNITAGITGKVAGDSAKASAGSSGGSGSGSSDSVVSSGNDNNVVSGDSKEKDKAKDTQEDDKAAKDESSKVYSDSSGNGYASDADVSRILDEEIDKGSKS